MYTNCNKRKMKLVIVSHLGITSPIRFLNKRKASVIKLVIGEKINTAKKYPMMIITETTDASLIN